MKNPSTRPTATEFVSIALTIFSWLFPDIQFSIKVSITIVLISIILISRLQPTPSLRGLNIRSTLLLFGTPILTSILMYYLASLCFSQGSILPGMEPIEVGLAYSLLVSLPIVLIGATLSKTFILGLNLGIFGSLLWLVFADLISLAILNLSDVFNAWVMSISGPIAYALAGNQCDSILTRSFNVWIFILVMLPSFLIPAIFYIFGAIWKANKRKAL